MDVEDAGREGDAPPSPPPPCALALELSTPMHGGADGDGGGGVDDAPTGDAEAEKPFHPALWAGAVFAHLMWGCYPPAARYLQDRAGLPAMSLLALANAGAAVAVLPFTLPRVRFRVLARSRMFMWLLLIIIVRSATNMLAARWTLAVYVQLLTQLTPFLVAAIARMGQGHALPRFTLPCLVVSFLGAVLLVAGRSFDLSLTWTDAAGCASSTVSTVLLAGYMVLTKETASVCTAEEMWSGQLGSVIVGSLLLSPMLGEDWRVWGELSGHDWGVFVLLSGGTLLVGNAVFIYCIREMGAPRVSLLIAIRLIASIALGAALLGEDFFSPLQVVGALFVAAAVTSYLTLQRHPDAFDRLARGAYRRVWAPLTTPASKP